MEEKDIISQQVEYFHRAMSKFYVAEILMKDKLEITWREFEGYLNLIDYDLVIRKIELLKLSYPSKELLAYLRNVFIEPYIANVKELRDIIEQENIIRENWYKNYRGACLGRFLYAIDNIYDAVERVNSGKPSLINEKNELTVKVIVLTYFYLYKKGIYPIPEIIQDGKKTIFYNKLALQYKISDNSIQKFWPLLEKKDRRLMNGSNIKLSIKLLSTLDYPNIKQAIELAKEELKEAELK